MGLRLAEGIDLAGAGRAPRRAISSIDDSAVARLVGAGLLERRRHAPRRHARPGGLLLDSILAEIAA